MIRKRRLKSAVLVETVQQPLVHAVNCRELPRPDQCPEKPLMISVSHLLT